ncbi:TetR/AcrR family transcriptional regulator [Mariniluteicoccus endophyticus]
MENPRPAARSPRMPRDQRRAQLLGAAGGVFADKGYHAAAMDDIAEAAGVSKPVLYQHFPSKLELYQALLDSAAEALTERVTDAMRAHDSNKERVRAAIGAFYDFVSESGRQFRFVFESDLTDVQVQQRIWQVHQDLAQTIGDVITTDTDIPEDRARLLGVAMVGLAQVSARHWVAAGRDIPVEEASNLVASLVWRGIASFPKTGRA